MTSHSVAAVRRRDRWASWAVVGVVALALLLGWGVKALAENRTVVFQSEQFRIPYPAGWVRVNADAPIILQVEKLASPARTTLTLQRRPAPPDATNPLGAVQQALTLERGRTWTAYRVLNVEQSDAVPGRDALRVTFAYVANNPNPFMAAPPVVMLGQEYLFPVEADVQIVTMTAAEANYERATRDLQTFLRGSPK
jgi:hypothetical protein